VTSRVSKEHRDHPEAGCPTAALVSEIVRQPAELQATFQIGIERFIALVADGLDAAGAGQDHDRAVLMFAAMVGGLALSRAIRGADEAGSDDILRAVRDQLQILAER